MTVTGLHKPCSILAHCRSQGALQGEGRSPVGGALAAGILDNLERLMQCTNFPRNNLCSCRCMQVFLSTELPAISVQAPPHPARMQCAVQGAAKPFTAVRQSVRHGRRAAVSLSCQAAANDVNKVAKQVAMSAAAVALLLVRRPQQYKVISNCTFVQLGCPADALTCLMGLCMSELAAGTVRSRESKRRLWLCFGAGKMERRGRGEGTQNQAFCCQSAEAARQRAQAPQPLPQSLLQPGNALQDFSGCNCIPAPSCPTIAPSANPVLYCYAGPAGHRGGARSAAHPV
jgi:hypothetical protein